MKFSFSAGAGKAVAVTAAADKAFRKFRLFTDFLPQKLQRELRDTRITGAANLSNKRAVDAHFRRIELGMIEEVEEFGAELQGHAFGELRVFQERHVPVIQSRYFDNISSRVAERSERRRLEAAGIEVAVDRALIAGQVPIAGPVCALKGKSTARSRDRLQPSH